MSDLTRSRIRTTLPQLWGAVLVYLLDRAAIGPQMDAIVYAVIPAAGAVIYDLGRRLEQAGWTRTATVLLGKPGAPHYEP